MLRRLIDWVHGWLITLEIRFRTPELYRQLRSRPGDDDPIEVGPPE